MQKPGLSRTTKEMGKSVCLSPMQCLSVAIRIGGGGDDDVDDDGDE